MWRITYIILLFSYSLFAQKGIDVHAHFSQTYSDNIFLDHQAVYYQDETDTLSLSAVLSKPFEQEDFYYYRTIETKTCWLKVTLTNSSDTKIYPLIFIYSSFDHVQFYELPLEVSDETTFVGDKKIHEFLLNPKEDKQFLIRLQNLDTKIGRIQSRCWLWDDTHKALTKVSEGFTGNIIFQHFKATLFSGFFIILFLYHLMIFVQTKQTVYLFYSLYVLTLLLYFYPKNPYYLHLYALEDSFSYYYKLYNILIQPIIYFWYTLFVRSFIQQEEAYRKTVKFLDFVSVFCLFTAILLFLEFQFQWTGWFYLGYNVFRVFITIFCCVLIVQLIINYKPIIKYIAIGASFFMTGALIASALSNQRFISTNMILAIDFMKMGSIIEVLIFALGLGARIQLIEKEKQNTQKQLIEELQKNKELQTVLEQRLQQELSLATYEKEIAQLESRLLRSRMNPHFIFNSMNALKRFVLENKQKSATTYLDQFAILLRQVLTNSGKKMISLQDELDALQNYLALEQNRLQDEFYFQIVVDPNVDTHFTQIPPMLLQPFVENAIWHGVRHLQNRKGEIIITIEELNEIICISIEDNGIGRTQAAIVNQKIRVEHKSIANGLTNQRLALLKSYDNLLIDIQIIDKPQNSGTIVRITMAE